MAIGRPITLSANVASKTISITVPDNFRTVPLPGAKAGNY